MDNQYPSEYKQNCTIVLKIFYSVPFNLQGSFISYIVRDSLVARITACRVVDRGSIPRRGDFFFTSYFCLVFAVKSSDLYSSRTLLLTIK